MSWCRINLSPFYSSSLKALNNTFDERRDSRKKMLLRRFSFPIQRIALFAIIHCGFKLQFIDEYPCNELEVNAKAEKI